jgi:N-acetylglucosaminyl-diphospho-decaprenol L-rhamnosyltransferase
MPLVDVVVVTFNSGARIRASIEPLASDAEVQVVAVDNASTDTTLAAIADLDVRSIALEENIGFGAACNVGWRSSRAPWVLFLNPDTRIEPATVRRLAEIAASGDHIGALGPKLVTSSGELDYSLRRFPRLRSTFARAVFLQRILPHASWVDEVIRDPGAYAVAGAVDWITGACLLVRRTALEEVGGFDERFFMYCEDKDLCARLWDAGYTVGYEPSLVCEHEGGKGSEASRVARRSMLTRSRIIYAGIHSSRIGAALESVGLALEASVRLVIGAGGLQGRRGRIDELLVLATRGRLHARRVAPQAD